MSSKKYVGVSLPADLVARLDAQATKRGLSRSEVVRQAAELALPYLAISAKLDVWRVVANIEYLSAFVDAMLTREHPDLAQVLPKEAIQRMEKFHA